MAQNTKIEWAHHTVNLWWGCTEVHEGCDNCYARTLDNRYHKDNPHWGNDAPRKVVKSAFNDLQKYQKLAEKSGEIHRVFVGSMMDIFEKSKPLTSAFYLPKHIAENTTIINAVREKMTGGKALPVFETTGQLRDFFFQVIVPLCPNIQFLLLTKRPSNINKYIPDEWKTNPPSNVMFGTSVVNQETADKLIPQLLQVKGKKFLSCEPLLGAVDLKNIKGNAGSYYQVLEPVIGAGDSSRDSIHWIIAGGESGHKARPMHPDWARSLRDQCKEAGVPFLFKQWGEWGSNSFLMGNGQMVFRQFINFDQWVNKASTWVNGGICLDKNGHQLKNGGDMMRARDEQRFPVTIMHKVGKTTAGKLLDGVEYLEFPKP